MMIDENDIVKIYSNSLELEPSAELDGQILEAAKIKISKPSKGTYFLRFALLGVALIAFFVGIAFNDFEDIKSEALLISSLKKVPAPIEYQEYSEDIPLLMKIEVKDYMDTDKKCVCTLHASIYGKTKKEDNLLQLLSEEKGALCHLTKQFQYPIVQMDILIHINSDGISEHVALTNMFLAEKDFLGRFKHRLFSPGSERDIRMSLLLKHQNCND